MVYDICAKMECDIVGNRMSVYCVSEQDKHDLNISLISPLKNQLNLCHTYTSCSYRTVNIVFSLYKEQSVDAYRGMCVHFRNHTEHINNDVGTTQIYKIKQLLRILIRDF